MGRQGPPTPPATPPPAYSTPALAEDGPPLPAEAGEPSLLMAPPSPRTTTARAKFVAVGGLTGASPARRPRHGGAKHRKTEGGEAPKPVQETDLRK